MLFSGMSTICLMQNMSIASTTEALIKKTFHRDGEVQAGGQCDDSGFMCSESVSKVSPLNW